MSSIIKQPKTRTDWYEQVCRRLDALKQSAAKYADSDDVLPACGLYNLVKQTLRNLRHSAGFPHLITPDVWLGPGGEIGVTWESDHRSLELLFHNSTVVARLTIDSDESVLEPKLVPITVPSNMVQSCFVRNWSG